MSKPIFREPTFSEKFDEWIENDLNVVIFGTCTVAAIWIGLEILWHFIALFA